jgi:hypothetical protein
MIALRRTASFRLNSTDLEIPEVGQASLDYAVPSWLDYDNSDDFK